MTEPGFWRRCSNCKSEIALGARYWICSVTTCHRVRAPIQFCKPDCWAVHNEIENHRDGWAVEKAAPTTGDAAAPAAAPAPRAAVSSAPAPRAAAVSSPTRPAPGPPGGDGGDILVVASRFKEFLAEVHGVRCSDDVFDPLSEHLRRLARESLDAARRAGRKTLLDRDVPRPAAEDDVPALVVVSRFKAYVAAQGDVRTSDEVIPVLTAELRRLGGQAAEHAKGDGRKTVLGRDVPRP